MNINNQKGSQLWDELNWPNIRDQIGFENEAKVRDHVLNKILQPMINIKFPVENQFRNE